MAKKDKGKDDELAKRAEKKLRKEQNPEEAARLGSRQGVKDAFCPRCETWYDSNTDTSHRGH